MRKMPKERGILRLNLDAVERSLSGVQRDWHIIESELSNRSIGKKDAPFNSLLKERMIAAYNHLDTLLRDGVRPFSEESIMEMCRLNEYVHYGDDKSLRREHSQAIAANEEKYYRNIIPIVKWHKSHTKDAPHPLKVASEVYVAILGYPQLFIEGNHRTGSIIASWIDLYYGHPPFVLGSENAVSYFEPSAEIKFFADKSTWRGKAQLPKYNKIFKQFWEAHIDWQFVLNPGTDYVKEGTEQGKE